MSWPYRSARNPNRDSKAKAKPKLEPVDEASKLVGDLTALHMIAMIEGDHEKEEQLAHRLHEAELQLLRLLGTDPKEFGARMRAKYGKTPGARDYPGIEADVEKLSRIIAEGGDPMTLFAMKARKNSSLLAQLRKIEDTGGVSFYEFFRGITPEAKAERSTGAQAALVFADVLVGMFTEPTDAGARNVRMHLRNALETLGGKK
jgi:hypothetical protein